MRVPSSSSEAAPPPRWGIGGEGGRVLGYGWVKEYLAWWSRYKGGLKEFSSGLISLKKSQYGMYVF